MAGLFDKAKNFLKSEQGDQVLDRAAQAADKATGGKHRDKITRARAEADKHLGRSDGTGPAPR